MDFTVPEKSVSARPASIPSAPSACSPISIIMCGCRIREEAAAISIDSPSTIRAGNFSAIRTPVTSGTTSVQGVMLNLEASVWVYTVICAESLPECINPSARNMTRVMTKDGTVVIIRYLICLKSGVPEREDAITVVSESGEILSPKYAPEMMAPAIIPSLKPWALPIPRSATPIVAIVVHELPIITETIAHIRQAVSRNILGEMILTP